MNDWMAKAAGSGAFLLLLHHVEVLAMPIDLQLVINPTQICRDVETCANANSRLFEVETDAVWAQAGIDVDFLPMQSFIAPADFSLNYSDLDRAIYDTRFGPPPFAPIIGFGENWFDTAPGNSNDPQVVDLWFLDSLNLLGLTARGIADGYVDTVACNADGQYPDCADEYSVRTGNLILTDAVFGPPTANLVLAHEIGHVLGLHHPDLALSPFYDPVSIPSFLQYYGPDNLMNSDAFLRSSDLSEIAPLGSTGTLVAAQIDRARQSSFLRPLQALPASVPVPSTLLLLVLGLFAIRPGRTLNRS